MPKKRKPDDVVKSCYKMESGLRLGQEGIHACQLGPFSSPIYFTEEEASKRNISKSELIEKRKWIFELLNDEQAKTPCKGCSMVIEKKFKDVRFDRLGHIDLAATTTCNLRCNFCGYTHFDSFDEAKYDALDILSQFSTEDVTWNSAVDFNGGEPTLLHDFDKYLKYFESRRTRVFLFTNGLIYKQSVYDGLVNGTIRWVIVSLDAGTKSTYNKMKLSPKFDKVLENIARYSDAGSQGGGNCAVKYIFHEDNSNDDDVLGFCYSMLALRPQEVWLTFDFDPLCNNPADSEDLGGHDYSPHIEAYAKTYLMLEKHGLQAVHYAEKHLAPASRHGVLLLEMVKEKIEKIRRHTAKDLHLRDFRKIDQSPPLLPHDHFRINTGSVQTLQENQWVSQSFENKRVAIAPASPQIKEFISLLKSSGANILAIADKDKTLHAKVIDQIPVLAYEDLVDLNIDYVFVATANSVIEPQIIAHLHSQLEKSKIFSFSHEQSSDFDRPVISKKERASNHPSFNNDKNPNEEDGIEALKNLIKWSRHTP